MRNNIHIYISYFRADIRNSWSCIHLSKWLFRLNLSRSLYNSSYSFGNINHIYIPVFMPIRGTKNTSMAAWGSSISLNFKLLARSLDLFVHICYIWSQQCVHSIFLWSSETNGNDWKYDQTRTQNAWKRLCRIIKISIYNNTLSRTDYCWKCSALLLFCSKGLGW